MPTTRSPARWAWVPTFTAPRPIAAGLFNAIPESPPLTAPAIPEAGSPGPIPGARPDRRRRGIPWAGEQSSNYYAVLPDGLQQISPVLAAILRNANSYGLDQPPRLGADKVAKLPVSRQLDTSRYPEQRISLLDATHDPVTCAHWSKASGASTSSLTLLAGSALPIPDAVHTEDLVGAGAGGTASRIAMAPGTGYFAQTVGRAHRHRQPGRCSGSLTPGCATASTTRPPRAESPETRKRLRHLG